MPELPEVETMRRGIGSIVGARIAGVARIPCRQKPILVQPRIDRFARRVHNSLVRDVGRAGKRVVVWLDTGDAIIFEPRMTGLILMADPPDREYLRLRFQLSGRKPSELLFWDRRGLGSVRLLSEKEFLLDFGADRLGPDALTVTADGLRQRLAASRRAIKVALLDQKAIAGIGNLYAAEILHVARIHPRRRCDRLTRAQWTKLADATRAVLEEAILYEGSTLSDGTYRNALNHAGGYQHQHRVYAKAGEVCPTCGVGVIRRIVQAQRSTFYCPRCQRSSLKAIC